MSRHLIVCDVETTGLEVGYHSILEVAAINVTTGEELYFVPALEDHAMLRADGDAMRINRYYERGVYKKILTEQATDEFYDQLWDMLLDNTLAGSNPRFDAGMLLAARNKAMEPWHHRLADLAAYAAPALGLPPTELAGLDKVCKALDVETGTSHSALDDARATAECFRKLARLYTETDTFKAVVK